MIVGGRDVEAANLPSDRALERRGPFRKGAAKLSLAAASQRRREVEDDDVVEMVREHGVDVLGADRARPTVDACADVGIGGGMSMVPPPSRPLDGHPGSTPASRGR